MAKRIEDFIETLMRVYAHQIAITNRGIADRIEASYGTGETKTPGG